MLGRRSRGWRKVVAKRASHPLPFTPPSFPFSSPHLLLLHPASRPYSSFLSLPFGAPPKQACSTVSSRRAGARELKGRGTPGEGGPRIKRPGRKERASNRPGEATASPTPRRALDHRRAQTSPARRRKRNEGGLSRPGGGGRGRLDAPGLGRP